MGLVGAAGLWGFAGASLGLVLALLAAPLAARWTRGGWAAGCAWAVVLAVALGAAGLYAGATYGVARQGERLVQEEWLLERVAATALLAIAEERGLDEGRPISASPIVGPARERMQARMASAFPGAAVLGLAVPDLVSSVLDALEGTERLTPADLHGLRLGAGGAVPDPDAPLSSPARDLIASTAPVREQAVAAIRAAALPHFLVAGLFAGAGVALIVVIGVVSRLLGRRRAEGPARPPSAGP
ncbi:MAG: hypothetical protein ACOC5E_02335 [Acidobacteriota bacterium]